MFAKRKPLLWKLFIQVYGEKIQDKKWWYEFENNLGHVDYSTLLHSNNGHALGQIIVGQLLRNTLPPLFGEWLNALDLKTTAEEGLLSSCDSLFFTFNYTMLLEEVYHVPISQVWHIHNSIADYKNGGFLIVGPDPTQQELMANVTKYKSKDITSFYIDEINQEISTSAKRVEDRILREKDKFYQYKDIKHVISMGFSFNDIDMPYIKKIIEENKNKENLHFTVYWHSERDDEIFKLKLRNLGVNENKIDPIHW